VSKRQQNKNEGEANAGKDQQDKNEGEANAGTDRQNKNEGEANVGKQLLYYNKVVPVSKDQHGDWSVKATGDYSFARESNSVPLMAVEFPAAAAEYAIVFVGTEDSIMPVAILGAQSNENYYVDSEGRWDAKYIPAFVRRYPFVFTRNEDGSKFFLCIDEQYPGCNQDGSGERLFDRDGERTLYLDSVLKFVQEYQAQFARTQAFCSKLKELDLMEPMVARFNLPSGRNLSLTGFMEVNRNKLKALPPEKLSELARTDELELIYTHLQSMKNFSAMVERMSGHEAPEDEVA
jgi:hypothetical protein